MAEAQNVKDESPTPSQYATDETYDIMDNVSIKSGSETTISTVISCSSQIHVSTEGEDPDLVQSTSEPSSEPSVEVSDTSAVNEIDWDGLKAVENRMVCEDEDTALFLERLDHVQSEDWEECHHPVLPIEQLKSIIANSSDLPFNDIPNIPSINYDDSELSLWSALLAEYREVVAKVPKYASIMIRSGIPPALRGLAWKSMAEAGTSTLGSLYDSLAAEWTPFVKIIGRDLNRTFPEIKMFREKGGEGQMKLGRVLRAYSAYDMQVGYCQGLTFLTGPLLLHMTDRDAFCVLVKLMEDYELRSMFTADMSGLQLRMYQFESLFALNFPELYKHFTSKGVNNIYASQWFLSYFAVTCPLGMLVRIFDLSFAEGAVPTLMRVALAIMKRNEKILMAFEDDEQILQHMLGRCLWDPYGLDADLLIADVSSITTCTNEKLKELATEFDTGKTTLSKGDTSKSDTPSEQSSYAAPFSSFPFTFKWPVAATVPVEQNKSLDAETSRHSNSAMSITSYESEGNTSLATERLKGYQSSVSSLSSSDINRVSAAKSAAMVSAEQQLLKDQIASLSAEVETLKFQLQNRDRLDQAAANDSTVADEQGKDSDACCEDLRMELALAKTNEVLARQEIEQLKHALHTAALGNSSASVPPATPVPEQEAPKSWSIWG